MALLHKKMRAWLGSDLSDLDLLVIQIDGMHMGDHVPVAAIGGDGDGAKALSRAIRNSFGPAAAIQRCQIHKGCNFIERLDES